MSQLRRRRPSRPTQSEQDTAALEQAAAYMVGLRIVRGISDEDMIQAFGLLPNPKRRPSKRDLAKAKAKLRNIEVGLSDGRLSTFQRYARGMGMQFAPTLSRPRITPQRLSRAIRCQRRVQAKRASRPRRRLAA
jgi:hypothetical protein